MTKRVCKSSGRMASKGFPAMTNKPIIIGQTNLPNGTDVMVTLNATGERRAAGAHPWQSNHNVKNNAPELP